MRLLAALIFVATPLAAADVPSGQQITLHEVLVDSQPESTWLRFRFLAPQIARGDTQLDYATAAPDMVHLCDALAVPYIAKYELEADVIVISLMDRITDFAVPDPDATQFFEAFRIENASCIWEDF
ncbi:hypothetical protein C1J03_16555 [Sulfitobacter sp. SK012]|uniref:DUF6497 family protein n=1 Tax=Sulfitobacter sp. SK012 TaxID=1389005 RepID=UPI000E0A5297|nr:DUF6497 family protein [Sulfitobacter sp. SK012]AXI47474.1 hypothetical protein C1J03_16555 [Sulfitobacter sp. SK012]